MRVGSGRLYFDPEGTVSILNGAREFGEDRMLSQWHKRAACRGQGPADFVRGPKSDYGAIRELCETCPVRPECLDYALGDESLTGLWGGTTDTERRMIRRRRVA